jgi:DNA-binding PadR family transcriptional regulator
MAAIAVGETSPRYLCLGFVIQREDTVQGVDRRLKRRFASERFTRGTATKNLPSLAAEGLVELVAEGSERPLDRYRTTPKGEASFRDWLVQTELPPAVRDALQCKLEFFELEDIPDLIEAVHEQEDAFTAATDIAHERLRTEKRARRDRRKRGEPPDWRLELSIIKTKDAAKLGGVMAELLEALREDLEDLVALAVRYAAGEGW